MSKQSILIIGTVWVEPNASAAGSRMLQLIHLFLAQDWQITFVSTAQKSNNAFHLEELGIATALIELNSSSFDYFVKKINPSIVIFDRFMIEEQFGWRIAEYCPKALRILDTEDLHFLRKVRHQQLKKGEVFSDKALLKSDDTKREIASILRCDLSLIISTYEIDLLKNLFKTDEQILYYLPFLFDKIENHHLKKWKSFEEKEHFVFIGNFFHKPNVDAVITLKKEIWSAIRGQLPKAEIHIYGAYINQQIQQFHNPREGFIVKGFAENANEVVANARVVLAPLRFGAGIKGKLTEAMLCGTPSVTTLIGAEGMSEKNLWNGFVKDDFSEFSKAAVALYQNKNIWEEAREKGIEIINTFYDKKKLSSPFMNRIEELITNIEEHRIQNFFGSLLQYKSLQSTKYLSKWIEAKNKL